MTEGEAQLPALLFALQDAEGNVLLQLFAHRGDIRGGGGVEAAEILLPQPVHDLLGGPGPAVPEEVQNIKMEGHVPVSEAFGLEGVVQGIAGDGPAVHGQEHILAVGGLPEAHVAAEPAFDPAALVVIAADALLVILRPAPEAVDIELPHIFPDPVEIFDQLTVSHSAPPL